MTTSFGNALVVTTRSDRNTGFLVCTAPLNLYVSLSQKQVTIAEGFAEIDERKAGQVDDTQLDNLFKACRRELPGYEIRHIIQARNSSDKISLVEFSEIFMKNKKGDVANTFKTSIKEAKGMVNKRNNEVEVDHLDRESYLASHAYSLAERRAFSSWLNNNLGSDPDCSTNMPISVDTEALFSSLSDGIVLCKAINCARPGTVDERVMNKHPKGIGLACYYRNDINSDNVKFEYFLEISVKFFI